MSALSKKYGLVLKKPVGLERHVEPVAATFVADDNDDGSEVTFSKKVSASTLRAELLAKQQHEKALAEDPTIFDYDSIYDELQARKNEKTAGIEAANKKRKSKYAEQILEAHKKRMLAQQSREERKQQKEREAEAGQFDGKEKFVTSGYRQQLIEVEKFRLQEAVENRLNELTAVEKQKSGTWEGGFYRTLLNDMARDSSMITVEGSEIKQKVDEQIRTEVKTNMQQKEHLKKLSSLRKNSFNDETVPELASACCNKRMENSIYSDESDEEPGTSFASVHLKPGLNILKQQGKKPTKAEQVRQRFTPPPEHSVNNSEDESYVKKKKLKEKLQEGRSHNKQEKEKSMRSSRSHHNKRSCERQLQKQDESACLGLTNKHKGKGVDRQQQKEKLGKKKTEEERLLMIRKILAHRNGPEEIEKMRQRFLERKMENFVSLPL